MNDTALINNRGGKRSVMRNSIKWVISVVLISAMLLLSIGNVAASTVHKSGKGSHDIVKRAFIHYPKGLAAKGGIKGAPKDKDDQDIKAWYKYSGIHWANTDIPINYVVNLSNSGDNGSFLDGIISSFQVWEDDEQSSIDFEYSGSFTGEPSSLIGEGYMNGLNEVGWSSLSSKYPNAIAITLVWYNSLTGEIIEIDAAMNSDLPWSQAEVTGDPDKATGIVGTYDVQNIMTHEVGHWLMLEELYNKPARNQTMYGYGSTGEVKKRSLESGDIAGIREIYPDA